MSMSLRDQLLQAGLGSKKQAKQADQEQRQKQHQQAKNKAAQVSEQQLAAQRAQAAKAARDAELNRQQQLRAEKKARTAQVKELIEQNRLPKIESDDYYNFVAGRKIRRIAVNPQLREQLMRGEIVVVRCEGRYDVVPAAVAERIRERDEHAVIPYNNAPAAGSVDQDDPYKDYVVPDDLTW